MWLRTLLLALLVIFLVRAVARLLSGVRAGVTGGDTRASRSSGRPPVKMMADPVCGTFVVPGKALRVARGGETHYFCSEGCRQKWLSAAQG